MALSEDERWSLAALAAVDGIGPRRLARLLAAFGSARRAWRAGPEGWCKALGTAAGGAAFRVEPGRTPEAVARAVARLGVALLCPGEAGYPTWLAACPDRPAVLYARGALPAAPGVAVVGSRRGTPYGRWAAERIAGPLAGLGVPVVSGLARGVDGWAHRAALDAGGVTVAVLASGLDAVYPAAHRPLAREIVARGGALVAEYPPGTPAEPGRFPARNRIIAGLSAAVVVVEAGVTSGALITARYAADYGRDVFAVPGRLDAPLSAGTNGLLARGEAALVRGAADVLEDYRLAQLWPEAAAALRAAAAAGGPAAGDPGAAPAPEPRPAGPNPPAAGARRAAGPRPAADGAPNDAAATAVLAVLGVDPEPLDAVLAATGLLAGTALAALSQLELAGLVRRYPGPAFARTR